MFGSSWKDFHVVGPVHSKEGEHWFIKCTWITHDPAHQPAMFYAEHLSALNGDSAAFVLAPRLLCACYGVFALVYKQERGYREERSPVSFYHSFTAQGQFPLWKGE